MAVVARAAAGIVTTGAAVFCVHERAVASKRIFSVLFMELLRRKGCVLRMLQVYK